MNYASNAGKETSNSQVSLDTQKEAMRSSSALDGLLDEYRSLSDSQRAKGNLFEQLVRSYLLNDSQMRQQFAEVYLWRDWPGRAGLPDTGIDLVAIDVDDFPDDGVVTSATPAVAIQCKFYAPGTVIRKEHVDSFLSESGKEPFKRRIYIETTGRAWSDNAERAIANQTKPVSRVGLTDLRHSDIDWSTYSFADPNTAPAMKERKRPRDHQVTAIRDVMAGLAEHDRGVLVMACGTGKTYTSLQIAEQMVDRLGGCARIMFMVPSLALMSQTLHEWSAECQLPFAAWSVCSDIKVNRKRQQADDLADLSIVDLKIPPTTDSAKLAQSLCDHQNFEGLQVVFATYQSIDIVRQAQELAGDDWQDFDLIICDEAHRTTGAAVQGEDASAFMRVHENDYIRADKRLYMTATPRIFQSKVKDAAREKDALLASMDDVEKYGPVLHRLGFGEAVSAGLLTDYKVVVLAVPEEQVSEMYQIADINGELSIPETAKLIGCWNALGKRKNGIFDVQYGNDLNPMRRAVAFAKDIKTSKQIAKDFPELVTKYLQNLNNDDPTDNLGVECQHVDGTMNAIERGQSLDWLKDDVAPEPPITRILTNARCLSEGVDVPTLDAVLFLNPRKSQVDVIQAVGRVMRKAEGKEYGYIILPVAVPVGATPESALNDNKRFQVVWQVLQAIRAHDERFDSTINSIEFNDKDPENIIVDFVDLTKRKPKRSGIFDGDAGDDENNGNNDSSEKDVQLTINLSANEWKDAVYSKIVKKVGNRLYWDDWSEDIADIASRYINLIERLLEDADHQDAFDGFLDSLQATMNPAIDAAQAVEMLAQHLITKPLFDAMFPDQDFTSQNPVSKAMQAILDRLASNTVFETERAPLEKFYEAMTEKIRSIDSLTGKQQIMVTLYDRFFSKAFPAMQDRLGIVFTPVPVVDYILHSAEAVLVKHFGKSIGDPGVALIEPFLGTGTFVTRLLQSGIIRPDQLEHKYKYEIFANEIVLLSYYIASVNIEQVYHQIRAEQGFDEGFVEFPGITLTDTFQLNEGVDQLERMGDFQANLERVKRQRNAPIRVVVMNPPYSAGQKSANDNNQNLKYPSLDERIASTYADRSSGTNKNSLYDSYYRSLRWATDRIGDEGIIAFVSNSSFVDGNTADGVRLTLQDEFSDIYIYNLKGNQRTQGERSRQEGGKIFGSGSRTGVAITLLVKTKDNEGEARIHYAEVADYLARQEKLDILCNEKSVEGTEFDLITPNEHGDWLDQRDESYLGYQEIGDKKTKGKQDTPAVFRLYSAGLQTNRDAWCYNYSREAVMRNMRRMIANYNIQVEDGNQDMDPRKVSWSSSLNQYFRKGQRFIFTSDQVQLVLYRPFCKQSVYFDKYLNHRVYQLPYIFPTPNHPNLALGPMGNRIREFSSLLTNTLPDLEMVSKAQWCSLYTWHRVKNDDVLDSLFDTENSQETPNEFSGTFDFTRSIDSQVPYEIDGYRRRDNITDTTLSVYRVHYKDARNPQGERITKEDIFFYIYALLHHPEYRERFDADLKKMLPRIPKVSDFWSYSNVGRELAELHVNYENIEAYPGLEEKWSIHTPQDAWQKYRVQKITWGRGTNAKQKDFTRLIYNDYLEISGIPSEVNEYKIGGRSPLEWIVDRYQITTNKDSGITNDPNNYCREIDDPAYIVKLISSLVTVSMRTQSLIEGLPVLEIQE